MNEEQFLKALEKGDMEEAQRILRSLRTTLPRTRLLYFEGMVLDGLGEPEDALKKFNMALVLHLSDPSIWLAKARVLQELDKMDMARRAVDRACRLSSGNSAAHLLHAEILYKMKDHRGAMLQIDEALDLAPDDPEVLTLKGILVSTIEEDYRKALSYFDKALTSDEDHAAAWTNRGVALKMIGDRDGAIYSFQKALILDGEERTARDMLKHMGAESYIVNPSGAGVDRKRSRRTRHLIDEAPRGHERRKLRIEREAPEEKEEDEVLEEEEEFEEPNEDWDEDVDDEGEMEELSNEEDEDNNLEDVPTDGMKMPSLDQKTPPGEMEDMEELDQDIEELEEEDEDEIEEMEQVTPKPTMITPLPKTLKKKMRKKKTGRDLDLNCPRCGSSFSVSVKGRTMFSCPSCGLSGEIE